MTTSATDYVADHLAALALAGWSDLAPHEQAWVTSRLAWAASRTDLDTLSRARNPGALRSSDYGSRGEVASLGSLAEGYQLLVGAARRAAFRLGVPLPPRIPLRELADRRVLERADSGDLGCRMATDVSMAAAVRDLRQQWEGLDRVGVGQAILPAERDKAITWRQFRDAWDGGQLGDQDEAGWYLRVGGAVRELVRDANIVLGVGVWSELSPEQQKIEDLRQRLRSYRTKIETSGIAVSGTKGTKIRKIEEIEEIERDLTRLSEPVWHAPGEIGALEIKVGLALGWAWFGAPSDAARATFSQLMHDWADFEKDGVPRAFPWLLETHAAWVNFKTAWLAEEANVTELSAMVMDANRVRRDIADALARRGEAEANAAKKAEEAAKAAMTAEEAARKQAEAAAAKKRAEDARRAAAAHGATKDITAPDVEQSTDVLRALYDPLRFAAEQARGGLAAVSEVVTDAAKKVGDSIAAGWAEIPWQWKAGAAAVLGFGALAALSPYARILAPKGQPALEARGTWLPD